METILLGSLITLGYMLDKNDCNNNHNKVRKQKTKNVSNLNNDTSLEVKNKKREKKTIKLDKKNPLDNNIINNLDNNNNTFNNDNFSGFSSVNIEENNILDKDNDEKMVPFYGTKLTQNMDLDYDNRKLNLFTGSKDLNLKKPKKEVENFIEKEKQNIYGGQVYTDAYQSQLNKSRYMTNQLPFVQRKIAPGVGIGVDGISQQGFHADTREYELPKTVDELRAKNNPRISFKGRMNKGKSLVNKRDAEYKFSKFKNAVMFVNRPLESTGGNIKKKAVRGQVILNDSNRSRFFGELKGGMKGQNKTEYRAQYRDSNRKENKNVDSARNVKMDAKFDTNKDSYNFPVTKKEILAMEQFEKELHIGNFLEALLPIRHYEDEAKKTIKETTVDYGDKNILNLKSNQKEQKYFDDKARKTVKETTIHYDDKNILNLKSNQKEQKYFEDKARKTIKETTVHNVKDVLNIKLFNKLPRRIKQTIARTLKEHLLHTPRLGNILIKKKINKDEIIDLPKLAVTLKDTLLKDTPFMNLLGAIKNKMYFNDKAKTTHKETISDKNRIGTAIFNLNDGYKSANFDMKETNKETTSNNDYTGIGNQENGDGYKTANFDMKETNKETTSNNDYFGTSLGNKETMSYEDIYNATINDIKETTLVGRQPTFQGPKESISSDDINMSNTKKMEHKIDRDLSIDNINNAVLPISSLTEKDDLKRNSNDQYYLQSTSNKNDSINDIILANQQRDTEALVKQFKSNPYAMSISK